MLPELTPDSTHRDARRLLESRGWRWLARGDWAQVYVSPDGRLVARVVPFDPAFALHVRTCLAHPEIAYFQRIVWRSEIAPAGEIVVMPRLDPPDPAEASLLCCRLGRTKHLERAPDASEPARWESERLADPALATLHAILEATAAWGERHLGFFGGLDVRPENVMQDADGQLVLIDPYFVAGPRLIPAMLDDIHAVARHYSASQLQGFLEIAVFEDEQDEPGPVLVQLRERVARLRRCAGHETEREAEREGGGEGGT